MVFVNSCISWFLFAPQHFLHFDDGRSALEPRSTPRSALGQPLLFPVFAEPFDPFPFTVGTSLVVGMAPCFYLSSS